MRRRAPSRAERLQSCRCIGLLTRRDCRFDLLDEGADAADSRVVDGRRDSRCGECAFWPAACSPLSSSSSMKNGAALRLAPTWRLPSFNGSKVNVEVSVGSGDNRRSSARPGRSVSRSPRRRDALPGHRRRSFGEVAELAVGSREILQCRAASSDRFGEDVVNCGNEPSAFPGKCPAGSRRMDSGAIERFADVDVAEACDDALVEEQQLDRRFPAFQPPLQLLGVDIERLGSERLERRPFAELIGFNEVERSEPPRIIEREPPSLVGLDDEMVVLGVSLGSIRQCPDMPRWKTSVSPRSVSMSPYFARRQGRSRARQSGAGQDPAGSARRKSGRRASTRAIRRPLRTRSRPRTVVSTSGSSGMRLDMAEARQPR